MHIRTGIFIQARSNSSRLPGKIYSGIPDPAAPAQLEHIYWRLSSVGADELVVLIPENDFILRDWCRQHGMDVFTGSELDVRDRYRAAARHYGVDLIVRATGDNPCVDPEVAADTILSLLKYDVDLFSYSNLPLGAAVEAFYAHALHSEIVAADAVQCEHVSLHIKHNPDVFRVRHDPHPLMDEFYDIDVMPRLTVDTSADLSVIRYVFSELGFEFSTADVLRLFSRHPEPFRINQNIAQREFAISQPQRITTT